MKIKNNIKQEFLNYREIGKLEIRFKDLEERVKRLEQIQTYYPYIDTTANGIGGSETH